MSLYNLFLTMCLGIAVALFIFMQTKAGKKYFDE